MLRVYEFIIGLMLKNGQSENGKIQVWQNAGCHLIYKALPNEWLKEQGLYDMEQVETNILHQYYE